MRGKVTLGYYEKTGFADLAAGDEKQFVELACRIANDLEFRDLACRAIRDNAGILFENPDAVRDLKRFFLSAYESLSRSQ